MKWIKAALVGALAALVMLALMIVGIRVTGMAPFNQPPSAAFLDALGLPPQPLAVILHFAYAIFWSIVLVAIFGRRTGVWSGLGLGIVLYLILMLIYAPIIGWGAFGIGGTAHDLPPDDPMYLGSPAKFIVITLVIHLIYGGLVGWLNRLWIRFPTPHAQSQAQPSAG